jgi:hypothetical protein
MPTAQSKLTGDLRELVRIASATLPKQIVAVSKAQLTRSNKATARLFRALAEFPEHSDAQLMQHLQIEGEGANRIQSKFRMVKSRLKKQLLTSLFSLDLELAGFSSYSLISFEVYRSKFLARVLAMLNARELSVNISRTGLMKAKEVEDWASAMEFLIVLRSASAQEGQSRSFSVYSKEYLYCQKMLAAEQEAITENERLQMIFARSGQERPELVSAIQQTAVNLQETVQKYPSFKLQLLLVRMKLNEAQLSRNYSKAIQTCEEAVELLDQFPRFSNRARRAYYALNQLAASVQMHDQESAEKAIVNCKEYLLEHEDNWFVFKEWEFLHLMHTLRFSEAYTLVLYVFNHKRYTVLTEPAKEKWELFRLYADFVTDHSVEIKASSELSDLAPIYSADKTSFNTNIVLLHLMLIADRMDFAQLRDRAEFLKGYRKRFLRGRENSHAAHFFGMLGMIETCDLDYKKIVSRTSKLRVELLRIEKEDAIQGELILPYSWIWERLMERLQKYHHLLHR